MAKKQETKTRKSRAAPLRPRPFHPCIAPAHGQKIDKLLANRKLPRFDKSRVQTAKGKYQAWVTAMDDLTMAGDSLLAKFVELLNDYNRYIEIELIYDSPNDFLYRQSGQHKVGNSILEEFLPRLADTRLVPGLGLVPNYTVGPQSAFAAFTIIGNVHASLDTSIFVKEKNQDYAISKKLYLKASTTPAFEAGTTYDASMNIAYLAAECKTNLDKTMFNEGLETSRALKQAVASARYLLICEWLDMKPIDTKLTPIDEAIILRGRRLPADFREQLDTVEGRKQVRAEFVRHLIDHPLRLNSLARSWEG
ncbi:MAG TPA: Bpu10I family restriction endonuclease [Pirellulales bacterium]|nr:Bpu10I family restriction endonuclease [Pirellulales bacterium]